MQHLNQITLCGVVGSVRHSIVHPDYTHINYSVATDRMYKTTDGSIAVETTWHQVLTVAKSNSNLIEGIQKGRGIYLEGYVRHMKYTDVNGIDKVFYQVVTEIADLIPEKK